MDDGLDVLSDLICFLHLFFNLLYMLYVTVPIIQSHTSRTFFKQPFIYFVLKPLLLILTWRLTRAHPSSTAFNSHCYGSIQNTVCPLSFANSSVLYITYSLSFSHILCFYEDSVSTHSFFLSWHQELSTTFTDCLSLEDSFCKICFVTITTIKHIFCIWHKAAFTVSTHYRETQSATRRSL